MARLGRAPTSDATSRMPGGAEPLERGKDLSLGAAADRARVRGEVRPHAGRPLPPRRASSCAGGPTSRPRDCRYDQLEVTPPYELGEGLRRACRSAGAHASARLVVGIERLLRRPLLSGTCCRLTRMRVQVRRAAAHRVDQHVGGLEVRRRLGMPRLPALEAGQRVLLLRRARPISISGCLRHRARAVGRLHARRLARLLLVVRRPGRVAEALAPPGAPTARAARRASRRASSMPACRSPTLGEARRHGRQREVRRIAVGDLVPRRAAPTRARRASAAPTRPRRRCGPWRSGCSRGRRRGAPPSTTCWWRASGARRSTSRASASAARRTWSKVQRRSMRTLTWMPREPEVFGQPRRPKLVERRRARPAPPRARASQLTPGPGSRSTRSSSG